MVMTAEKKGRPLKYEPMLSGMDIGDDMDVWAGISPRYCTKLVWSLNTGKVQLPPGGYRAVKRWDGLDDVWIINVTRVA